MIKIVKSDEHDKMMDEYKNNEDFKKHINKIEKGRKLNIDIEITDEIYSQLLFDLLYSPNIVQGVEMLGFKINCIYNSEFARSEIKQKLQNEIMEIINQM